MSSKSLLSRQSSNGCVPCPQTPPACACSPGQQCILIDESCSACASFQCISNDNSSSSHSGGVSEGAVAGAVVGTILALALIIGGFFFYRRRVRQKRAAAVATGAKPADPPARAEDVLGRPDPNEKVQSVAYEHNTVRVYPGASGDGVNLDPDAHASSIQPSSTGATRRESGNTNPFEDSHSIQTTSTGTQSNVIPIALVTGGVSQPPASTIQSNQATAGSEGPTRPARSVDLDINLQREGTGSDPGALAASGVPNNRMSFMTTLTNGSYASDFLNEAPIIVTPTRSTVKQVVGVMKADYVRTPGTLAAPATRPPVRSPLAASSFSPADTLRESDQEQEVVVRSNPFSDEHSPYPGNTSQTSPAPSASTFGTPEPSPQYSESDADTSRHSDPTTPNRYAAEDNWVPNSPHPPFVSRSPASSRPISAQTNAGSIIAASVIGADIGTVTRVHLGFNQLGNTGLPATPSSVNTVQMTNRMTSARLVAPPTSSPAEGAFEMQQRVFQQGAARPESMASVMSTSTRADSILESFPFVPPSPISNRPIRTPPRSPLAQGTFAGNAPAAPAAQDSSRIPAPDSPLPAPPNRKMLGMSVASQSSTASNGLGSFPFQIDHGARPENADSPAPPSSFGVAGRQRASLDTLAITSDLSSYPLGFDQNAPMPPPPRR